MSFAFPRRLRLLSSREFSQVFAGSERSADRSFVILSRDNGLGYPRLGLAISKKRVSQAVSRNRIKRVIRESFRLHQGVLPSVDLVVMAGKAPNPNSKKGLYESLEYHWNCRRRHHGS